MNSIYFAAANRTEVIGTKQAAIDKAQRASDGCNRLMRDLQEAQQSPGAQTSGCGANGSH
jgi:hypothetical protein